MIKTKFKDLFIIQNIPFRDNRGYFKEIIREEKIKKKFPFLVMSFSKRNVIRGLHLQKIRSQGKFVSVIKGKIFDVAVDLRKNSKTFGKHFKIILSEKNCTSIFIPEGFAHGFGGLGSENIIVYSCTNYRYQKGERGLLWNDKDLKINWGIKRPILSIKDKINLTFQEYQDI